MHFLAPLHYRLCRWGTSCDLRGAGTQIHPRLRNIFHAQSHDQLSSSWVSHMLVPMMLSLIGLRLEGERVIFGNSGDQFDHIAP